MKMILKIFRTWKIILSFLLIIIMKKYIMIKKLKKKVNCLWNYKKRIFLKYLYDNYFKIKIIFLLKTKLKIFIINILINFYG